jgi:hypothetical protein
LHSTSFYSSRRYTQTLRKIDIGHDEAPIRGSRHYKTSSDRCTQALHLSCWDAPEVSDGGLGRNPIAFLINKAPPIKPAGLKTPARKIPRTQQPNFGFVTAKMMAAQDRVTHAPLPPRRLSLTRSKNTRPRLARPKRGDKISRRKKLLQPS